MRTRTPLRVSSFFVGVWLVMVVPGVAQTNWQTTAQGDNTLGVANLTRDYTVRDWANYHNTKSFSPNGRWVCYTRYAADGKQYGINSAAEIHVADLHTGQDRLVDNGHSSRWANIHNWLFYLKAPSGGAGSEGAQVWWLDLETDRQVLMGTGINSLGETSFDDRWIFGAERRSAPGPGPRGSTEIRRSFRPGGGCRAFAGG